MIRNQALRKIDKRIYLVFIILIAITLINALISTFTIRRSQNITSEIVYTTHPSLNALSRMNLLVTRSRMLITNWVYLPHGTQDRQALNDLNTYEYITLRGTLTGLMQHWPDTSDSRQLKEIFHDYESLVHHENTIMHLLYKFEDYGEPVRKFQAEELLESEIIPRAEDLTNRLQKITESQTRTALHKQDAMLYRFNSLMVFILGFAILIVASVLFATLILSRSVIVPVLHVRDLIIQMGRGELPEMKLRAPDNAVGEMSNALGFMINGFRQTSRFVEEIGKGNFDYPYEPLSSKDVQGHALITMRNRLREAAEGEAKRTWIAEGLATLNKTMRSSNEDFTSLLNRIIDIIVSHLKVQQAAIFLLNNDDLNDMHIQLGAYYALNKKILNSKRYELKEGLIGQAVASNQVILLENQNDPYFTIDTGFGEAAHTSLMIVPLTTSGKVVGAIEVASTHVLSNEQKELLMKMAEPIAANMFSVRASLITSQLLEESRKQAEELANQEQELRKINNTLTLQSDKLKMSEEELKTQQEELKLMNIQLREKARLLEEQNLALEETRLSLSFKATQLEESNQYKSAFLANMSHELRTPLNSILILARLLADNKNKLLSAREIEHAQVIHKSGTDLLNLINDILDLSKIEAGKIELLNEEFSLQQFTDDIHLLFREVAADKKIDFRCDNPVKDLMLCTDQQRLAQIIKNLLSNAFKFTPEGGKVTLTTSVAAPETVFNNITLLQAEKVISIQITDTGIGIPKDKQRLIFEAFQQADGSTSRKFGGTGLGLSITKELVNLMDGEITVSSKENEGSTFTVYLPGVPFARIGTPVETSEEEVHTTAELKENEILDDRHLVKKGDGSILIIEDDHVFAKMLMNQCHRYDCHAIIAAEGEQGLEYAKEYQPRCIILDLRLPVMDGWTVLKKIKADPACEHIPVHILTSVDKMALGLELGAASYLQKPVDQQSMDNLFKRILQESAIPRQYLYVGRSKKELQLLRARLEQTNPEITINSALPSQVNRERVSNSGCIVIGSRNTDEDIDHIRKTAGMSDIPMVYLNNSPDECLAEIEKLFAINKQSPESSDTNKSSPIDELLRNKVVLLADDDMRNIYCLTNILEDEGMHVISAFDGQDAMKKLTENPEINIVLMDIMMPNMNGLDAIKAIRKENKWKDLPVIAVTAKAMSNDRETCLEAGASDYLTKPVSNEQLLNLMRVWLHK